MSSLAAWAVQLASELVVVDVLRLRGDWEAKYSKYERHQMGPQVLSVLVFIAWPVVVTVAAAGLLSGPYIDWKQQHQPTRSRWLLWRVLALAVYVAGPVAILLLQPLAVCCAVVGVLAVPLSVMWAIGVLFVGVCTFGIGTIFTLPVVGSVTVLMVSVVTMVQSLLYPMAALLTPVAWYLGLPVLCWSWRGAVNANTTVIRFSKRSSNK